MIQASFNFEVHKKENNPHSQAILDSQRERLNNVCQKVHELLLQGIKLNGDNFKSYTGANEYRRRFKNLLDNGFPVKTRSIGFGCKEWYYDEEYIKLNAKNICNDK